MLIQCEKCRTRYNLDEAKIPGKGAKVTCPSCKNVFVVMKDASAAAPPPSAPGGPPKSLLDGFFEDPGSKTLPGVPSFATPATPLSSRGIKAWKVRVASGLVYDFTDPGTLKAWIGEKKVTPADSISSDG